jgi:Swiss Army Knife RNA repair-like protein
MDHHSNPDLASNRRHRPPPCSGVPSRVAVFDVDGVVSPVKGRTAFGDDVTAGYTFGPVTVSPTVCVRLDSLEQHGVGCWWLTDWSPQMRARLAPFPGRAWPDVPRPPHSQSEALDWWKWHAVLAWLDEHPQVQRLLWCDDHLRHQTTDDDPSDPRSRRQVFTVNLAARGIDALLLAPRTNRGLTRRDLDRIETWART